MALVAPVEREEPHGIGERGVSGAQRLGAEVDERQTIGRGHAGDRGDARAHLVDAERWTRVGALRDHVFAARDRRPERERGDVADAAVGARHIAQRDRGPAWDRADVESGACHPLRERIRTARVGDRLTVQGGRPMDVGERWRRLVVHHDLVRRLHPRVHDAQRDGGVLTGAETS